MKKVFKQTLSVMLALIMTFSIVLPAFAEEENDLSQQVGHDVDYNATNTLGTVISGAMEDSGITGDSVDNYYIQDVTLVDPTCISVVVSAPDNSSLVVAVYDEATGLMVSTGKTAVSAETTNAEVILENPIEVEFFTVKAFLVNEENKPLCKNFESVKYTAAFQDFISKTTEDFEDEIIVNLDESEETNFAVVTDEAVVVEQTAEENILVTNDFENGIYVIENATEDITSLAPGAIFYFEYGEGEEDYILTKIKTIENKKGTVTITADENIEISDFFSYIKIDTTVQENDTPQTFAMTRGMDEESGSMSTGSSLTVKVANINLDVGKNQSVNITGLLTLNSTLQFYYDYKLFGEDYYEITYKYDLVLEGDISIEVEKEKKFEPIILFHGGIPIATGIEAEITLSLEIKFSGKVSVNGGYEYSLTHGAKRIANEEPENLSKKGEFKLKASVEGEVSFSLKPYFSVGIKILKLFEISCGYDVTFKITAAKKLIDIESGQDLLNPDEKHNCFVCVEGDIFISNNMNFSVEFGYKALKVKILEIELTMNSAKLCDFYISIDNAGNLIDFGLTKCPNKRYRTTFKVVDENNSPVYGITLFNSEGNFTTDANGQAIRYYSKGSYAVGVLSDKYVVDTKKMNGSAITFKVTAPKDITIYVKRDADANNSNFIDFGIAGTHTLWKLDNQGHLTIEGNGEMPSGMYYLPWKDYADSIKTVSIGDGITSISSYAFDNMTALTNVSIPKSVKIIEDSAFAGCSSLSQITIPDSVETIGSLAFYRCSNLFKITIPDSVETIDSYAFSDCANLKSVIIGKKVKNIGYQAFALDYALGSVTISKNNPYFSADSYCAIYNKNKTKLIMFPIICFEGNFTVPDGVKSIEDYAFFGCYRLTGVTIPEGVTKIGNDAFKQCLSLANVKIPDSVKTIGTGAFFKCFKLANITIPYGVTTISASTFEDCKGLTSISIPNSVTTIGSCAFHGCSSLTSISIPNSVTVIGTSAFGSSGLVNMVLPNNIKSIERGMFEYCASLKSITIPKNVTAIGSDAFVGCSNLSTVYYAGTKSQWQKISIEKNNTSLTDATIIYSSKSTRSVPMMAMNLDDDFAAYSMDNMQTETIIDAVAGYEYIIAVVIDENAADILAPVNLLYIDQKTAEGEELTFEYVVDEGITDYEILIFGQELPHYHVYNVVNTAPTCTEQGFTTYTCSCGDTYIDDYADAAGHTDEIIAGCDATCTGTGLTDGIRCAVCGTVTTAQEEIPAKGHNDENHDDKCDNCAEDFTANCSHNCHTSGFANFFWKIINFLQKLFGVKSAQYCDCGLDHWA